MTKMTKPAVTLAATAAIAAPAAQAAHDAGNGGGALSPTAEAALLASPSPDDRSYDRATVDIQTRALKPVQLVVHDDGGFDWGEASIGGVAAFALALILAGLGLLIARSRRRAIGAA